MSQPTHRAPIPVVRAWAVHVFTASGAVLAFLAFMAVERGQWRLSLLWLGAALVVDGIDGSLARKAEVKRWAPAIDGSTLDLVVDYLTYVFVPAILVYRAGLLPDALAAVGVAAMLLSSLYTFARTDMKTEDNFFRGFPAVWNVVAFYLFILHPAPMLVAAMIGVFTVLTFAPIHFIHPVRVKRFQPWLGIVTAVWSISGLALLLWPNWSTGWTQAWLVLSVGSALALLGLGLLRTIRGAASPI